jgi:dihydroxyacetone kinase-like predicted kinase
VRLDAIMPGRSLPWAPVPALSGPGLVLAWARASLTRLAAHRPELDGINVFPVADADTGTNLLLTMRSAVDAAEAAAAEPEAVAAALARGALLGACGNSGVILSQVLRGLAEAFAAAGACRAADHHGERAAAVLADALSRGVALASAALTDPREGTALTVLAAAAAACAPPAAAGNGTAAMPSPVADGAAAATPSPAPDGAGAPAAADGAGVATRPPSAEGAAAGSAARGDGGAAASGAPDALVVAATAAADAAATAVRATTAQLPELGRAGVVDAGGMGVYLLLDALVGLLTDRPPAPPPRPGVRDRPMLTARRETGSTAYDYEVMYLLDTSADAVDGLRDQLAELGDSVAVVGDGRDLWHVHLHCNDIGAAVEAGVAVGRPHRITVVRFADQPAPGRFVRDRAVLMIVVGGEVGRLARAAGAAVLERPPDASLGEAEIVTALTGTQAHTVVLLPGDPELVAVAERAAATVRHDGQEVLVMPTASVLQSLSALAVHDPTRRAGEDVVAMAEAAAGTRVAALVVAETEALTWAGRCEPGDVLGIADGEVVLIAPDLPVGALWLAHRMLLGGGEIVTALLGAGTEAALAEGLAADLRRSHPEVDVVVHRGGQTDYPLVLGVE